MSTGSLPIPITLPHDVIARVDRAAKAMKITRSQVILEAMKVGLRHWERLN